MSTPCSLITGGAGFLGSHVVQAILDDPRRADESLLVLDDLSGGFEQSVPQDPRVQFVQGCVCDADLIRQLFERHRFALVYHLAAYAAEGLSHYIRRFNYFNNVVGSATLLSAALEHGCRCFVFTSSIAAYGSGRNPLRESDPLCPEDPYGVAKYTVELDLAAAHDLFGLDFVVFRPHNVYGERQNLQDRYRNVVGIFMNQILQGKPMTVFGDGSQQRAFSYVADVAPIIARAPHVPTAFNETFNIGADEPCSVLELAQEVAQAMGVEPQIEHLPPRHEVQHAWCDHSKLQATFSPGPATPLQEGLQRMAAWARQTFPHGAEYRLPPMKVEVTRQLPDAWKG